MSDDRARVDGPAPMRGGGCAVAGVRGDVTTMRAAEAVKAARGTEARPGPARVTAPRADGAAPFRLQDVGPA